MKWSVFMKYRNGFTLIELLAVIVILAVIALIATPIVLKIINNAKFSAAKATALGYIDSVNQKIMSSKLTVSSGIIIPEDNELTSGNDDDDDELDKVKLSGKYPDYITIVFENNKIKSAGFCINGYNIDYSNGIASQSNSDFCKFATVTDLQVTQSAYNMKIGNTVQIQYSTNPTGVVPTFLSSNNNVATVSGSGLISAVGKGQAEITVRAGIKRVKITVAVSNDSILGIVEVSSFQNNTIRNITANGQSYSAHVYTFEGNQIWSSNMTFGDSSDVATQTSYASNMVIVKVNGDLTINSGVTVSPYFTQYGGPKGFLLYVTGTLTNNGNIDNGHGAKATGQNVYLWQNSNSTYEYVPALGALGAPSTKVPQGANGSSGISRSTGGGGKGSSYCTANEIYGGGSNGTSYSGGSGGGGNYGNSSYAIVTPASQNGGKGGSGGGSGVSTNDYAAGGSGAGNPAGESTIQKGQNGTGGLLILYSKSFINRGTISANGSIGGKGFNSTAGAGAGSGAGSINIFYSQSYNSTGSIVAKGGLGGIVQLTLSLPNPVYSAGNGGNGSITIGSISSNSFVSN